MHYQAFDFHQIIVDSDGYNALIDHTEIFNFFKDLFEEFQVTVTLC